MVLATSVILVTDNYHTDLKLARQLGLVKGNPKKQDLYAAIAAYNKKRWEAQGVDELTALLKTENDISVSRLPKPILKKDRKPAPRPILKKNLTIVPNPLKRPTPRPVLKSDRIAPPRPKLGTRFNRNLFQ